ncbi:response regulator transcription factor [Streptosporangium sp. NPDC051023]|uniref:response regulator transcription factor n=1 Tax=Streptosporangium sp. NPDC051023 TaxID=3155410 RepID=UPI00344EE0C5
MSGVRPARGTETTLIVAEDETMVRAAVVAVLDAEENLRVVGEAAGGEAAVELAVSLRPDVALLDIRMPCLDGLAATARILAEVPGTRVIVLTSFGLDDYVFGALRAGAAGFLLKDSTPERIIDAVHVVSAGDALLDPALTRRLIGHLLTMAPRPARTEELGVLTPREREVLAHVARGLSNGEIGARLGLSPSTVKGHVATIIAKLGVRDRVQAAVVACETGLVGRGAGSDGELT